jgi:hypothetical protein
MTTATASHWCCTPGACTPSFIPAGNPACQYVPSSVYSCTGQTTPTQLDPSLWCVSAQGGTGGQSLYCCLTSGCSQAYNGNWNCDPTTTTTEYRCVGNATPPASAGCGAAMPITAADSYCCCTH